MSSVHAHHSLTTHLLEDIVVALNCGENSFLNCPYIGFYVEINILLPWINTKECKTLGLIVKPCLILLGI